MTSPAPLPRLVAEFRAIMSDDMGGTPSAAHCRAVIEWKAAALPAGPELWALWHVEHGSDVATLCEFDGSVCYECYRDEAEAQGSAARLNADGYSEGGRYIVARIPAGVAGNPCGSDLGSVRASGPVIEWASGMDCGYTTCTASVADLSAPAPVAMVAQPVQQAQGKAPAIDEAAWQALLADDEDDGCPKGDPECLGDNGDCHDACEAPARTFTVTITTTGDAEPGPFGRTIAQDHSADSLFVLLDGLLDGVTGVRVADVVEVEPPAPAMVPQPCQQAQAKARAPKPARGERRYVEVRDTETGEVHRVLTSVARVGVAVVIFTPSNRHREGALGGMLITHDDRRKAWVFNDEAEAQRALSRNGAPGERIIRAELIADPARA